MNKQHIPILDIIRGFAITGIIFANIPWLAGYHHVTPEAQAALSSTLMDQILLTLAPIFIDNKFYSIFSLLFGLGLSILFTRSLNSYLRRLLCLFILGWLHAILFFYGDILRLYAVIGCVMCLFKGMPERRILLFCFISFFIPVLIGVCETFHFYYVDPGLLSPALPENLAHTLQHGPWEDFIISNYYRSIYHVLHQLPSRRFFKIVGLFLLGFYLGHKKVFHHLDLYLPMIKRLLPAAWGFSLITNTFYSLKSDEMSPWFKEIIYILSVYPLAFTYMMSIIVLCKGHPLNKLSEAYAKVGRMSLTNYLAQSVLMNLFMLWCGFGLATQLHVYEFYLVAIVILIILFIFSHLWLKCFQQGPVEYLVRRFSYK